MASLFSDILGDWRGFSRGIEDGGHHQYRHKWAMVIDLDACTGCNACVTACYTENNLAVVGEDQFRARQAMNWLRIERYWDEPDVGQDADSQSRGASFLPMMCQQCDAAPCEPVCPVGATYHNPDSLNVQVYNRCVGSRYCANNCPYRVRNFNFYSHYDTAWPEPLNQHLNPDVSVRDMGVMEKCTFCIQRIQTAKIKAKREGRALKDGDVVTACQQTCPTQAITFGDLMDESSRVAKVWKKQGRGYRVFEELNTEPAVQYLERVRET